MSRACSLGLMSALLLASCTIPGAKEEVKTSPEQSILENAMQLQSLSTFVGAAKAAGLNPTLNSSGPFTVWAPSNAAFDTLPGGALRNLLHPENQAMLSAILTYHVVPGSVAVSDLRDGEWLMTINGARLKVTVTDAGVWIGDAKVERADIASKNGMVHVVSAVLFPPAMGELQQEPEEPEESSVPLPEEGTVGPAPRSPQGEVGQLMSAKNDATLEGSMGDESAIEPEAAPTVSGATYAAYREGVIGSGEPVVLFFHAPWCPYCQANDTRLLSWYGEGKARVSTYKIDYDTASGLKQRFGVVQQNTFVKIDSAGNVLETVIFPAEDALKRLVE